MSFYYFSILGFLIGIAISGILIGLLVMIWPRLDLPRFWLYVLIPGAILAPWSEEWWIAYNFGQFCRKDAGLFIYKTVEVDGFYDDTTHWWRQLKEESQYQFVESRDNLYGTLWRVERNGDDVRHFKIDKPTARYHYTKDTYGVSVSHKVDRQEGRVIDTSSGEILGRYTRYSREPYSFYLSFRGPYGCDGPDGGPNTKHGWSLLIPQILKPKA